MMEKGGKCVIILVGFNYMTCKVGDKLAKFCEALSINSVAEDGTSQPP